MKLAALVVIAHRVAEPVVARLASLPARFSMAVNEQPVTAAVAGIGASIVAVLQSAQEVVGTLIALLTSLAGLATAIMAMRAAWKKKDKE